MVYMLSEANSESHDIYDKLQNFSFEIVDLSCPEVKKIYKRRLK